MLKMKEKALLVIISALIAVLTASLIHGSWVYEVELTTSPGEQEIRVPAGKTFNISCRVSGGDQSKVFSIEWLNPEGNIIREGNPSVVKEENNLLFLTFTDPKKSEDNGTYKCQAVYDYKYNLHYTVNIVFYGPDPEFEKKFENISAIQGEKVEIFCYAEGETPMTYSWTDPNSDTISDIAGSDIYVRNNENGSTLIMESARFQDQGMYTCTAKNTHGLLSKLYYIGVYPAARNDSDNATADIEFVNITARTVQLRISINGPAAFIQIKYTESRGGAEFRRSFFKALDDIYTITDLTPGGLYTFQFRIADNNETQTWSKAFRVTLLPDVPEIIFRRLEKGSLNFEWFIPTDDRMRGTIDMYEIKYYTVQMQGGNSWEPSTCVTTIQLPSCRGAGYTISGLSDRVYYQIEVRSHTESGYGEPAKTKIYLQ